MKKKIKALLEAGVIVARLQDIGLAWYERRLNIETSDYSGDAETSRKQTDLRNAKAKFSDSRGYSSPGHWNLFRVARRLRLSPGDVVYDIGCGKGRVLCVMATFPVKRVVGVELLEELCAQARANADRLRGRKASIEVRCADASDADLSGGTAYFFYLPFGPETFAKVLENIRSTTLDDPREIKIAYYKSRHEDVLNNCGWLRKYDEYTSLSGDRVTFWRNAA